MAQVYALPGGGSTTSVAVAQQHGVSTTPTVSQQQQAANQAAALGTGTTGTMGTATIAVSPGFQAKYEAAIAAGERPSQPVKLIPAPAEPSTSRYAGLTPSTQVSTFPQMLKQSGVTFEPKGTYAATTGPTYNELGQIVKPAGTDYTPKSMAQDVINFLTMRPTSPEFSAGVSFGMMGGLITDIAWGGIGMPKPTTETVFKTEARATTGGKITEVRSDILTKATLGGEARTFRAVAEAKPLTISKNVLDIYHGRIAIGEVPGGGGAGATVIAPKTPITLAETTSVAKALVTTPTEISGIGVGVLTPMAIPKADIIIPASAQMPVFSSLVAPIESAVAFKIFPRGTITAAGITTSMFEKIAITETRGGALGAARGFERFPSAFIEAPVREITIPAIKPVQIMPSVADITAVRGVEQFSIKQISGEFEFTKALEKMQVFPVVAIKTIQSERITPMVATRLTEGTQVIQTQSFSQVITPTQFAIQAPKIAELNLMKTGTMAATATVTAALTSFALPSLISPLMPAMRFPDMNIGSVAFRKRKGFKFMQPFKFFPSYSALAFGIKGKAFGGIETGIKLRPVPKGFDITKALKVRF